MFDFASLFVIAGLVLGLVVSDAALYGDTLRVQIAVPQAVNDAGFTEATAEEIFTAEAAKIVRGHSIIAAPEMRVHSNPSVIGALAKPLNLDGITAALQSQFGINHLMVSGAVLAETGADKVGPETAVRPLTQGVKLDFVLVVTQPGETPVQTVLEQPDGDATMLVRRGADWAMEQVAPYRVVLAHTLEGFGGNPRGFPDAEAAAERLLARPWDPERVSDIALTYNLLGLIAMQNGDLKQAGLQFDQLDLLPDVLAVAQSEIDLNHCFLAIALKQPKQASAHLEAAQRESARPTITKPNVTLRLMEALTAWSNGDAEKAETLFRQAAKEGPNSDTAHHYLAQLLLARGDTQGAAREQAAVQPQRVSDTTQALAVDLFWTDPVKGGVTRRF